MPVTNFADVIIHNDATAYPCIEIRTRLTFQKRGTIKNVNVKGLQSAIESALVCYTNVEEGGVKK